MLKFFVADPDPGSWIRDSGQTSWIRNTLQPRYGYISAKNVLMWEHAVENKWVYDPVWYSTVLRIRIRDPGLCAFLTPGSRISDPGSRISDPGSQTHIFESLVTTFWVKSSIILWNLAQIFFLSSSKLNNFTFCEICGYKKMFDKNFFSSLSFLPVFGSGIRDPRSGMGKNQDPGSGINIPDPPHWYCTRKSYA